MKNQEKLSFKSEVKQLLKIMVNSLYSNKEIFLRELISNASDAVEKIRFLAISNPDIYEGDINLHLRVSYDKDKRTLTLSDNGIGMHREEVIENLGNIAKSGTKSFLDKIRLGKLKANNFIGQFGVGFYSSFIVADKVVVFTRAVDSKVEEGVYWESTGEGDYIIGKINKISRGTDIILHLREGEEEFLNDLRLKSLINKYADHIALSIELKKESPNKDLIWEKVNKAKALWTCNKSELSDEEYKNFYKTLSNDLSEPLIWSHNFVEGTLEYISLLYIPNKAPWDIWNRDHKCGLKLYVQRVFIMENASNFLPHYLRFIKGIIDTNDLSLNVSREILQDNKTIQNLKNSITKRVLYILEKLAKDNEKIYNTFWQEFRLVLKEGIAEDSANRVIISSLLRFSSTYDESTAQSVSLDKYISRMKEKQEKIYYITADSYVAAKNSPHLEYLINKGYEVLLLTDRIDEWMMNYLTEYKGKGFHLASRKDENLESIEKPDLNKETELMLKPLIERVKNYLKNRIKEVRFTNRLTDTASIVTIDGNGITTQMAKLLTAAGQNAPNIEYILEINPNHFIVKRIASISDESEFCKWVEYLFNQALFLERGTLDEPHKFIKIINQLLKNNNN